MSLRQYVRTLPGGSPRGAMTALLWNRTDAGVADQCESQSQGKTLLTINVPTVKRDGTPNPASGRIAVFVTDSDAAPAFATGVQLLNLTIDAIANIPMVGDYGAGFVWALAEGPDAIEIHVVEARA